MGATCIDRVGRRRAETPPRPARRIVLLPLAGAVLALAAWAGLVLAAITFGRSGRDDDGAWPWVLTVVTSLGAAACLLLVFVLVARARAALRPRERVRRGAGGRHR